MSYQFPWNRKTAADDQPWEAGGIERQEDQKDEGSGLKEEENTVREEKQMGMTLGKKIAKLRKEKGVTQDELAERMNVSPQAVSKWENDISCPDIMMLPQLADYFGVSIDNFFREDPEPETRLVPKEERKDFSKMLLKVNVLSGKNKVKINLPMPLVKMAAEIGMQIPQVSGNEYLKQIDLEQIVQMVETGLIGKLVEVEAEDGTIVEIVVE